MWESVDFSACAKNHVLFASDGSGRSRKTPQTLRQVAFGVATFDMHIGNDTSFTLQQTGYLGGQVPGKQTVPRAELWGAIQILSKVDGKSNIQIPIDAKYVTRCIAHRGDLVQGPNGDLWSILFQLIDEHSGVTDFIKVKSHLEDAGPSAIKQNKIAFHHMLANSLADVVAEEAAKRLLPDLNLERKAKWAERVGFGVAKRLALVQADIWAKRSEAGDICELDPLLVEETTCKRTAFSTLVDELAHQGHLLVRHNKGLRCKACNVYRAYKQFRFRRSHLVCHGQTPPRSSPNSKTGKDSSSTRQQETRVTFSTILAHATKFPANTMRKNSCIALLWVIGTSSAHTVTQSITLCLFLLSQNSISHTLINVTPFLKLPSGELSLSRTLVDPKLHYGQNSTTQKPFLRRNARGTSGCSGSCPLSVVEY